MLDAVRGVCARWELPCTAIGAVTDSGALRAFVDGDVVGEIPASLLTDECPRYEVEQRAEARPVRRPEQPEFDVGEVIEQYDHLVGSRTVRRPGLDAAVLRLGPAPGETDGFRAGVQATLGAARNVACTGGEPIGLTDCLNFGNPEKPAIAHELAQAIEGIAQAAEALGIPVVSGNVSLYNDADGASIPPTPVVGCVGLVPDVRRVPGRWQSGDAVLLASSPDGSLAAETALIRLLWKAAPHLTLCHDAGSGGIEAAFAEAAAWSGGLEAAVELPTDYDSRRGAAILACRPGRMTRIGSRGL